jgi:hypothetical protein
VIVLRPSILQRNSKYDNTILNETFYSVENAINTDKLEFLENINDAEELGNLEYLTDDIQSYATKFRSNITEILDVAFSQLAKIREELSTGNASVLLTNVYKLKAKESEDLSMIEYSMFDYNINMTHIKYIDLEGILIKFHEYIRRGISESDLVDLIANNAEFLTYTANLASESEDIDTNSYRQSLHKLYRNNLTIIYDKLYIQSVIDMIDKLEDLEDWIAYIDAEIIRLTEFGDRIKLFLEHLSSNSIVNNIMHSNVSINIQNNASTKYSSRAESVATTRKYLMSFMDWLYNVLEIYISTVVQKSSAIKDEMFDVSEVLNVVLSNVTEPVQVTGTLTECTDYHAEFSEIANNVSSAINESYLRLDTMKPREIMLESTSILLEAAELDAKIVDSLKLMRSKITQLTKKFRELIISVHMNNDEWLGRIKDFNVRSINSTDKAVVEIYPYWINYNLLSGLQLPDLNDKDIPMLINNENEYINKYFKKLITPEGKLDVRTVMRGGKAGTQGFDKVQYSGMKLAGIYTKLWMIIDSSNKLTKTLVLQNKQIKKYLDSAIELGSNKTPLNESILLESSIFADDYFMVLSEASGPMTTDEYEKHSSTMRNDSEYVKNKIQAVKAYARICYGINATRMHIAEEAYNSAVMALAKITKNTKMKKDADSEVERPGEEKKPNTKTTRDDLPQE